MKTAASLLVEAAERIAGRFEKQRGPVLQASLEKLYGLRDTSLDPILDTLQAEALREDW